MKEKDEPHQKERKHSDQQIGLRLQDVILNCNTFDINIHTLRKKVSELKMASPNADDRYLVLNAVSQRLLGQNLDELQIDTHKTLVPYRSTGTRRNKLIISSASSSSASQETETSILKTRGHVIDIPGAIEGRDTLGAKPGDTALISTTSGLIVANTRPNLEIINLAETPIIKPIDSSTLYGKDIYYKADALLLLMITNPESPVLNKLIEKIKSNPVIYPYNLDEETQIALLWLSKAANIKKLDVNANSAEVGTELTKKGYRYPTVEDALLIPDYDDPYKMQFEEWKFSQAAKEIGYHPDVVPGYIINRGTNFKEFKLKIINALSLLSRRYELSTAWIKPDRGTDGGNQGSVATKTISSKLIKRINDMWNIGGNWVVEAESSYFQIELNLIGGKKILKTAPSAHIVNGEHMSTIAFQLFNGKEWGGNLICSEDTWQNLIDSIDRSDIRIINNPELPNKLKNLYPQMLKAMQQYVNAINKSHKYKNGQVRGGADLAVATLGGEFGSDNVIVAVQDYNARANGCETARALHVEANEKFGKNGEAVTRNITPKADFNIFSDVLPKIISKINDTYKKNIKLENLKLIAVSAGWGQFGLIGTDALQILEDVFLIEDELRKIGLIA